MFYYIDNIKKLKVCRVTTSSNKIIKIDEFNKVTNSIKSNLLTSTYNGNYPIEITTVEFNDPFLPIVSNIKYNNFIFEGNNLIASTAGYYVIPYFGFQYWKEESLNNEITNIASSRFISQTLFNSNQLLNNVIYMMNLNDYYIFPKSDNLYSKVGYINNTIDSFEFNSYDFKTHEDTVTQVSVKYYTNQIDSFYTKYYYE